jgi:hypothetical protein
MFFVRARLCAWIRIGWSKTSWFPFAGSGSDDVDMLDKLKAVVWRGN